MHTKWKVTLLTLAIAIPAWMFGAGAPAGAAMWNAIWPWATAAEAEPAGLQIPLFMVIGVFEAVALGLAVSFLVWGGGLVRKMAGDERTPHTLLMISVAWLLGNWWVHDSLHIVNGSNYTGLLVIEYAFHVTLIIAGAYVAWKVYRMFAGRAMVAAATPTPAPARK